MTLSKLIHMHQMPHKKMFGGKKGSKKAKSKSKSKGKKQRKHRSKRAI
jgi:hypothetical protein